MADLVHNRTEPESREQFKAYFLYYDENCKDFSAPDNAVAGTAFAVNSGKPQFHRTPTGEIICHFCKEPGYIQIHCKKRNICNYCKKPGHMIGDCPILAKRGRNKPSGSNSYSSSGATYATTVSTPSVVQASSTALSSNDIRRLAHDVL
ncbi:hypothetical protein LINGRAHAP2_LOCUS7422 [Linum grandiflorum]